MEKTEQKQKAVTRRKNGTLPPQNLSSKISGHSWVLWQRCTGSTNARQLAPSALEELCDLWTDDTDEDIEFALPEANVLTVNQ
jgi:hypothetical protein